MIIPCQFLKWKNQLKSQVTKNYKTDTGNQSHWIILQMLSSVNGVNQRVPKTLSAVITRHENWLYIMYISL